MNKSWRDIARPIIAEVLRTHAGENEKVIREALRKAYPFGERKYHPYKIWCDEVNVQLGKRRFGLKKVKPDPNQGNLF